MLDFDINNNCYGCELCKNICPQKAISMEENKEGFLVPIIDKNLCIDCGLCEKKCIYLAQKNKRQNKKIYAMYNEDGLEREKSASGGIFYILAKKIIEDGGYVCGVIWNSAVEAVHKVTNDIEIVKKMRSSKYVQSNIGECYKQIKELLKQNKKILFSGTPCQVAGIKSMFGENDNLLTVAIICEGVPSPKVWKLYKEAIEKKYNSKIINVNFKNKDKTGWLHPNVQYEFENGKKLKRLIYEEDIYGIGFIHNLFNRNSCHDCQYKGENINADIIIGDLWGTDYSLIKKSKNKGLSVAIINTNKLDNILRNFANNVYIEEINYEQVTKGNPMLTKAAEQNKNRKEFFENLSTLDIFSNISRYVNINKKKLKVKKILIKINLYPVLLGIKYKMKVKK